MRYHFPAFVKTSLLLLVQRIKTQKSLSSKITAETPSPEPGSVKSQTTLHVSPLFPGFASSCPQIPGAKIPPIPPVSCQNIRHFTEAGHKNHHKQTIGQTD